MILHHYFLSKPTLPLRLSPKSTILKFTRTNLNRPPKEALYTTTQSFYDSDIASQMLSVTYYPKYDTIIDTNKITNFDMVDNQNKPLSETSRTESITKVWPAFGKTGGSHECLIIAPDEIKATVIELANGGAPDRWHQDSVENYNPEMVELIATGIIDALDTTDVGFRSAEGENYFVKAVGNGVATNSSLKGKNVTLSAAWKKLTSIPEFKFWACLWNDNDKRSIRTILPPSSETAILKLPTLLFFNTEKAKECLEWDLENHGYIYSVLTETIRALLRNIALVSDEFFECHSHKIVIPN
jgi:hypothetical protein